MPKPLTPTTNIQWGAIQNGANNNSLISQLYAGKPATTTSLGGTIPQSQTPPVVAASSAVKNGNAPVPTPTPAPTPVPQSPTIPQPITGNATTPSGATVNATTGQEVAPAPAPTYSGIIGSLANTSQQGSPTAQQYTAQTAQTGQGNIPLGQNAQNIAQNYSQQLNDIAKAAAQSEGGITTSGMLLPIAQGREGVVSTIASNEQNAITNAEQQALAGNQQALTAQNQAATAENEAAGQATTAQGQAITGLNSAGTLSEPSNAYSQLPFNQQLVGADGQPIGGAGGSGALQGAVVNAINLIKSGSGYSNAIAAANLGQFGPQGTTALLNALGPSFNVNSSDADAAAIANNINTSATATTNANAAAIGSLTSTIAGLSGARDSVANIANNLISQIATSNNLNPSNINAVNGVIQTIAGQTSNPQYQTLLNQMTDVVNTYAQVLTPGANTDASKATAQTLLNSLAQGSTVQQVISGLDTQAQSKIAGLQTTLNAYQNGTNPNPATSLTGQTVQAPDGTQVIITD